MEKRIELLRYFFRLSTATFEFTAAYGGNTQITNNKLYLLHKSVLEELEKENPNMEIVKSSLSKIESLIVSLKPPQTTFAKGGFVSIKDEG